MVADAIYERDRRWQLSELLQAHPGLRIVPSADDTLVLAGEIRFRLQGPKHGPIEDAYTVELRIPPRFPEELPAARETGGRIPATFHHFVSGELCLGAQTALRLELLPSPTLPAYVEKCVISYLLGHSYYAKHGEMPFGELSHEPDGILDYFAELFDITDRRDAFECIRLTSLKKRVANKQPCPCHSGRRLGQCHHRRVNELREQLGRDWFERERRLVQAQLEDAKPAAAPAWPRLDKKPLTMPN